MSITEIFKPQLFSSHALCLYSRLTEFFLNLFCLSSLLYHRVSSLMNTVEGECLHLHEISINVNNLIIVICVCCLRRPCRIIVICLLVYHLFFILMLFLYFGLFVGHVNKSVVLVLGLLFIILITTFQLS